MERLLLAGLCILEGLRSITAICVEPSPAEVPMKATRLSNVQPTYDLDWPLVYKCDQGTGYGYIQITCGGSSGWAGPARQCEEDIAFDIGSGIGVACFLFTLIATVVALSIATVLQKKKENMGSENEMSPRAQSPVAQNGTSSKPPEKAPMEEDRQTAGHQTEVDVNGTGLKTKNVTTAVEA